MLFHKSYSEISYRDFLSKTNTLEYPSLGLHAFSGGKFVWHKCLMITNTFCLFVCIKYRLKLEVATSIPNIRKSKVNIFSPKTH